MSDEMAAQDLALEAEAEAAPAATAEPPTVAATTPAGPAGSAQVKPAYPAAPEIPTQQAPEGIRFDFNDGCRVAVPESDKSWRVRLMDLDTGNTLFETSADFKAGRVTSAKRYYVRFRVDVWHGDELVLNHEYDARDRQVAVLFPVGTLGDTMGWFPYAAKFQAQHGCRLTCAMADRLIPLFAAAYPEIDFVAHDDFDPARYYATYRMGLFFDDKDCLNQPCDFRLVGLHRTAGYILGVDPTEVAPRLVIPEGRPIAEPYVCIATQSTTQAKYWNNPYGWHEIVAFLKEQGYRVVCIDQKPVHGTGIVWNHIPHGVEDQTGDHSLSERARWLKHADFFIGLSSGLSWLAWAAGTPVVMISGFTHPTNEFATPYRIVNYHTCNSCWNDPHHRFDHHDFLWCPRHKDTPRQFECTRLITAEQVKQAVQRIPGFGKPSRAARQ
ncbi:MAG TPA: autotransporter strand-loop-strand O-heptosyltransferase [Stellaceae bacterium]|nr:autotransporter strand-loop-strand O-heptosyltransferase [Stellaceae bacterium]